MNLILCFVLVLTIPKISCDLLTETPSEPPEYHFCESYNIFGDEIETKFENLKKCHVIEGHLRLHRFSLPEGASLPNLTQVTDYIILERVDELESLAKLFPRLSVIRGQNLFFDKYAIVLHANYDLREIGPWVFSSIMRGALHVESNIFMCTDEETEWNQFVRSPYRRFNFFKNNLAFCPFMGCESEGYCKVRDKTCKASGLSCPKKKNCSSECIGGCYKPSDPSACVACRHFQHHNKCVEKCPKNHLNYMNYRCVTYEDCLRKNYSVLDPKDSAFLYEEISPGDLSSKEKLFPSYRNHTKCIKDCPEKFIQYHEKNPNSQTMIRWCKQKRVCETTIITNSDLGGNLKYCNHVDGNLIIFITGGKNVAKKLEENLKGIETVSGYVKVAGADALYSLSFLPNLKRIEGKEVVNGGYSFYLVENSNLKEFWDWDFRSKELFINGSVYIHFNDRLCDSEIAKFRQVANIKDGQISNHTNGMNAPCNIFHTHLNAVPGSTNGSILLNWMHNFCSVDYRYLYGYQIFYRPVNKNISKYESRDVCNDKLFKKIIVELKVVHEPMCMELELKCLTPNTRYAIYVESLAVDNIKYQIESSIVYATTYSDNIEKPSDGKLKLRNKGLSLSFEAPKIPNFINSEELFYEILLTLDGPPLQHLINNLNNSGRTTVEEADDCLCSSISKDTYFIKEQRKESIDIDNEISSLLYSRSKNTTFFQSRKKRSSSQTFEVHDSICGLKSYRILLSNKYLNKACETMMSNSSDCVKSKVDWSSSPLRFKFKNAILTSPWKLNDDVLKKAERTENTNIYIPLPDTTPKNVTVEIRTCVGEISPCPPLHSEEACSICSDFESFVTLTVDENSFPNFEVEVVRENDSNNSGHKLHYASCMKTSRSCPPTYVDTSSLDIVEVIDNGEIADGESSNGSTMPLNMKDPTLSFLISWTEPLDPFNDFIKGYRILYYDMDDSELNSQKSAVRIYIPKSVAEERGNRLKIPVKMSSKKYIGFQIHYEGGYGCTSEKCLTVLENEASGYIVYLICFAFVVLFALSMAALYKFYKEISTELLFSKIYNKSDKYERKNYAINTRIDEKFRIEPNQLKVEEKPNLGSGFFGDIYKGTITKKGDNNSKDTIIPVAVKTINSERSKNTNAFNELLEEGVIMQKLDCFFIVKLIAISENILFGHPFLCIVLELMDTDLKKFLVNLQKEKDDFSEKEMVEILCQVSLAMSYLHENRFIHRDLAARNVLVRHIGTGQCPPITVKVADFGRARYLSEDEIYVQATDRPIPVRWTSPEALRNAKFWDKKCDVWSFGVLIYEIVTKSINNPYDSGSKSEAFEGTTVLPLSGSSIKLEPERGRTVVPSKASLFFYYKKCFNFPKYSDKQVKEMVPVRGIKLRPPPNCSEFLGSLMKECLQFDPQTRPTFTEILHKLLSSEFVTDDFLTWCKGYSPLDKCWSVDSKSDSLNDDNTMSPSTHKPCDNDDDDESDCDDNACLAPKECGRSQSSCLSVNCVHNTIFCRKKHSSKTEIDDQSFPQNLHY